MSGEDGLSYFIGGVRVHFPFKPYPSQMAMMAQIIKGLHKRQNCLIESPTGSGKSLALLCSTIAWLQAEEERVQKYNSLLDQGITDPDVLGQIIRPSESTTATSSTLNNDTSTDGSPARPAPSGAPTSRASFSLPPTINDLMEIGTVGPAAPQNNQEGGFIRGDDNDDDFKEPSTRFRVRDESGDVTVIGEAGGFLPPNSAVNLEETLSEEEFLGNPLAATVNLNQQQPWLKKKRVPKIFFGTRTHKQIYQITKELRRTKYKHIRSVVLGSREHTCIHPTVSKSNNKNERCRALRDHENGENCMYDFGASRMMTHDMITGLGIRPAWDIEDLVKIGRKVKGCPYYASRKLMETAQLIICPYNYLIDPLIRGSMSIILNGNILILDEAHNVEDCAREASSASITQDQILDSRNDLEKLSTLKCDLSSCKELITFLTNISNWMEAYNDKLTDYSEFNRTSKIFSGMEMVKAFDVMDVGPAALLKLEGCLDSLNKDPETDEEVLPKPTSATSQLLKSVFLILHYLFKGNMKYSNDYKVALVRTQLIGKAAKINANGWLGLKKTANVEYSLNFWCLNPGVSFSEIGDIARSVILTSGTLSPMDSFESELQVKFHIQLEANHVIAKKQVWVGTLANGPTNHPLNGTYQHSETWAFQDELGRTVLEICETIPRGVLCFFPSYSMLQKLADRWQSTSIWHELESKKVIITEPRKAEEFEQAMQLFYSTIENTKDYTEDGVNGVFFMAVCRGKVSEGIDFTDDNARAVITIGIPFPNVKDIQVDLKRQYNNIYYKSRGLLSGNQWYEIQAYRAINQALGRCIRHRYDWGALILIDERYQKGLAGNNKHVKGLSKWVRNNLHHQPNFKAAISQMKNFALEMIENSSQISSQLLDSSSADDNAVGLVAVPKSKFASPPQIFEFVNEDNATFTPAVKKPEGAFNFTYFGSSCKSLTNESPISATPSLFCINGNEKDPQNVILLAPSSGSDDICLTPIAGSANYLSTQDENLPKTSTQVCQSIGLNQVVFPVSFNRTPSATHPSRESPNIRQQSAMCDKSKKRGRVIGVISIQNTEASPDKGFDINKEKRLAPIFTTARRLSSQLNSSPLIESVRKKPKIADNVCLGSIDSNIPRSRESEAISCLNFDEVTDENFNSDDDLFAEESTQLPQPTVCKNSTISNYFTPPNYNHENKSRDLLKSLKNINDENAKSNIRASKTPSSKKISNSCTPILFDDSDLDDFQLETTMTQVKRRASKGRKSLMSQSLDNRKGVQFSDFE